MATKKYQGEGLLDLLVKYKTHVKIIQWSFENEPTKFKFMVITSKRTEKFKYPHTWEVSAPSLEELVEPARELIVSLEKRKLL